ncbi:hypothetical protein HMPREF1548_05428 [Clostridium sp. KLE 1755]|nr:hypothetical protein HMPREF1548_05428 [Clostridium sp. KLE 1755]
MKINKKPGSGVWLHRASRLFAVFKLRRAFAVGLGRRRLLFRCTD